MKKPIVTAAIFAFMTAPSLAKDLTLKEVRAMSDGELYELAGTLSSEDENQLYEKARKEFPKGALGLQSAINKFEKSEHELVACQTAVENNERSDVRALNELEPGTYFSLLRIVAVPTADVMDMTIDERKSRATEIGRKTNRALREFRECKRKYRKLFGDG